MDKDPESNRKIRIPVHNRIEKPPVCRDPSIVASHNAVEEIKEAGDNERHTGRKKPIADRQDNADEPEYEPYNSEQVGFDKLAPKKDLIDPQYERVKRMTYLRAYQRLFLLLRDTRLALPAEWISTGKSKGAIVPSPL
jgi:hypothetical protein